MKKESVLEHYFFPKVIDYSDLWKKKKGEEQDRRQVPLN